MRNLHCIHTQTHSSSMYYTTPTFLACIQKYNDPHLKAYCISLYGPGHSVNLSMHMCMHTVSICMASRYFRYWMYSVVLSLLPCLLHCFVDLLLISFLHIFGFALPLSLSLVVFLRSFVHLHISPRFYVIKFYLASDTCVRIPENYKESHASNRTKVLPHQSIGSRSMNWWLQRWVGYWSFVRCVHCALEWAGVGLKLRFWDWTFECSRSQQGWFFQWSLQRDLQTLHRFNDAHLFVYFCLKVLHDLKLSRLLN